MKANYSREPEKKKMTEVDLGTTLYDMNKQLMANETGIDEETLESKKADLISWIDEYFTQSYFMLLCNERKDYTVFHITALDAIENMADDVIECMTNRGTLLSLDLQEAGGWELWIRHVDDNECSAYYLFPYGAAVLEY